MATVRQIKFAHRYAELGNASEAARQAGYSEDTAGQIGHDLLKNFEVQNLIAERIKTLEAVAEIDAAWVLRQWQEIAAADTNELMQVRRVNCRHCNGIAGEYQWDEKEYFATCEARAAKGKELPDMMGGFGFKASGEINPECAKCEGEGVAYVHVADTRKLRGGARQLFDGVKQTKDGIEIKVRDKSAALANIAKFLGMSLERRELSGPGGTPIATNVTFDPKDLTDAELAAVIRGNTPSGG